MKNKYFFTTSLIALLLIGSVKCLFAQEVKVDIHWNKTIGVSRTTPTLQIVVNPLLMRSASVHDSIFSSFKALKADYVRFVPWFPYPHMAVVEQRRPTESKTYWDFTSIDPMVEDFMKSTESHSVMLNFSTIPNWMFKNVEDSSYLLAPKDVDWGYNKGTELSDTTLHELVGYYVRLFSWYTKGGFTDELGKFHKSGHYFKIPYWEVLNEPDLEHSLTPQTYTKIYDAVVFALKKIARNTKFVGLALAYENNSEWFNYFLNPKNHKHHIIPDGISYHFYGTADNNSQTIDGYQNSFFDKADAFLANVTSIQRIRKQLSPHTFTDINELGTIWGNQNGDGIDEHYWNLSGALFAYTFAELVKRGIDVVGESQLVGYPSQFPSVSMVDWNTGTPNARYRVLQLILKNLKSGDKLVDTQLNTSKAYAQAFITKKEKLLLLINKKNEGLKIELPKEFEKATAQIVDVSTGVNPPVLEQIYNKGITLKPYAVVIISKRIK